MWGLRCGLSFPAAPVHKVWHFLHYCYLYALSFSVALPFSKSRCDQWRVFSELCRGTSVSARTEELVQSLIICINISEYSLRTRWHFAVKAVVWTLLGLSYTYLWNSAQFSEMPVWKNLDMPLCYFPLLKILIYTTDRSMKLSKNLNKIRSYNCTDLGLGFFSPSFGVFLSIACLINVKIAAS